MAELLHRNLDNMSPLTRLSEHEVGGGVTSIRLLTAVIDGPHLDSARQHLLDGTLPRSPWSLIQETKISSTFDSSSRMGTIRVIERAEVGMGEFVFNILTEY